MMTNRQTFKRKEHWLFPAPAARFCQLDARHAPKKLPVVPKKIHGHEAEVYNIRREMGSMWGFASM